MAIYDAPGQLSLFDQPARAARRPLPMGVARQMEMFPTARTLLGEQLARPALGRGPGARMEQAILQRLLATGQSMRPPIGPPIPQASMAASYFQNAPLALPPGSGGLPTMGPGIPLGQQSSQPFTAASLEAARPRALMPGTTPPIQGPPIPQDPIGGARGPIMSEPRPSIRALRSQMAGGGQMGTGGLTPGEAAGRGLANGEAAALRAMSERAAAGKPAFDVARGAATAAGGGATGAAGALSRGAQIRNLVTGGAEGFGGARALGGRIVGASRFGALGTLGGVGASLQGGQWAGQGVNALENAVGFTGDADGTWDNAAKNALSGAAGGATAGAGIGSIFPVVGTGIGALVGAGIGGIGGALFGGFGHKDTGEKAVASEVQKQTEALGEQMMLQNVSDSTRKMVASQVAALGDTTNSAKELRAKVEQVFTPDAIAQLDAMNQAQEIQERLDRQRALERAAVQSWLGPSMSQVIDQQQFYANQTADAFDSLASLQGTPELGAATRALAANTRATAATNNAMLAQQAQLIPQMGDYQRERLQLEAQLAQLTGQQVQFPGSTYENILAQLIGG